MARKINLLHQLLDLKQPIKTNILAFNDFCVLITNGAEFCVYLRTLKTKEKQLKWKECLAILNFIIIINLISTTTPSVRLLQIQQETPHIS